jgi:pSer/pThr/pTyr-binding forkhead associated (FHA) protein
MATLRIHMPGSGVKVYHIYKKLTSLGKGEGVDILLPDPLLADTHAHIHFDGRDFNLAVTDKDADLHVNGRRRSKHRLAQEDRIRVGSVPS